MTAAVRSLLIVAAALCVVQSAPALAARGGTIKIKVVEPGGQEGGEEVQRPIAFRMHLRNQAGRMPTIRGVPVWGDHFSAFGEITLSLPPGNFFFEIECGPEYIHRDGHLTMQEGGEDEHVVVMKRGKGVDMPALGWHAGDLDIERKPEDVPVAARAETIQIAPVVTWNNKKDLYAGKNPKAILEKLPDDYFVRILNGKDERGDNGILYFNLDEPLPVEKVAGEYPPMATIAQSVRGYNAWRAAESPTCWDLPLWVALGCIDSINLAHPEMTRSGMLGGKTPGGKPRDEFRYRGARGQGLWSLDIYTKLLECGLRIPPSAGSGSGVQGNPNPIGHNRVYVEVDGDFTYDKWWQGLRAGRCYVTNGPLFVPKIRGAKLGETLTAGVGQKVSVEFEQLQLTVHNKYKISYLEIVREGDVSMSFRLEEFIARRGSIPDLKFEKSGWFFVRAVIEDEKVFRFAQTAPYFVTIGGENRVSKAAGQFFLDWLNEREKMLKITDVQQAKEVAALYTEGRRFWTDLIARANAD